jgi:hypothetical protein
MASIGGNSKSKIEAWKTTKDGFKFVHKARIFIQNFKNTRTASIHFSCVAWPNIIFFDTSSGNEGWFLSEEGALYCTSGFNLKNVLETVT